jgi:hypothetical protein
MGLMRRNQMNFFSKILFDSKSIDQVKTAKTHACVTKLSARYIATLEDRGYSAKEISQGWRAVLEMANLEKQAG